MVLVGTVRWSSRGKGAGSPDSGTIGATEDAASRRPAERDGTAHYFAKPSSGVDSRCWRVRPRALSARRSSWSGSSSWIGWGSSTMRSSGMPSRRACSSASSAKGIVPIPAVGMPRRSSRTRSCTLHDTHDPQSANASTARSARRAISSISSAGAGREKLGLLKRSVVAP